MEMTKASVSGHVRQLEEALGGPLFLRRRGAANILTPRGSAAREKAREAGSDKAPVLIRHGHMTTPKDSGGPADIGQPPRYDARFKDARKRLLDAARDEIVAHGIVGARINRIAVSAGTSKERLYAYFRDKDDLVQAVLNERMESLELAAPFDPYDLPSYAVWLFDFYTSHPDDVRLSQWVSLDRGTAPSTADDPTMVSLNKRVGMINQAQSEGKIDAGWDPLILLNLLVGLAMSWSTAPHVVQQVAGARKDDAEQIEMRRQAVRKAACRLVAL